MREQARTAMEAVFQELDLAHRLRQVLIPLMPKCEATLEHAAAAMSMSSRSLQRRLAQSSLKFQDVLDAVRKDLARVYLRDASLGALDVALLLGYAEQSSFTRAFKVWFGTTPSAWRRAAV
jgi:AraC-like DNA-binding protein